MGIIKDLGISENPFEHYTAELESNIEQYAVKPPYLESINDRAQNLSSFILFGERGAGKSATRITLYKKFWKQIESGEPHPFLVNFIDYTRIHSFAKNGKINDYKIVREVVFNTLEQLIIWLSSLPEEERDKRINRLTREERTLVLALMQGFYLKIPQIDRQHSNEQALQAIASSWSEKGGVWVNKNWTSLKQAFSNVLSVLAKSKIDENLDIQPAAQELLSSFDRGEATSPAVIIHKINECVKSFGFSGTCILVDKLDETATTNNSAEITAKLIYPILSHIQLLEIPNFSWVMFIWKDVRKHFDGDKISVRLDKIANTEITWDNDDLRQMLEKRTNFYSGGKLEFSDFFSKAAIFDIEKSINKIIKSSNKSPRELIKIIDTIIREHDSLTDDDEDYDGSQIILIDSRSIDQGLDKYCTENINYWYDSSMLNQLYRVGKTEFTNSDIRSTFKISSPGAGGKLTKWKEAGLVKNDGTVPSADGSGKPAHKYKISDVRVRRIIDRQLVDTVGMEIDEED